MHARIAARPLGLIVLAAGLAGAALSGCAGGGSYTKQTSVNHLTKMDVMKSATEYDMSHQSYLAGDLNKALERVERSIALNNQVAKSHVLRGRILLEMGELDGSLDALHTAEALAPQDVDTQYFLGLAYERMTERDEALKHYQAAADLKPDDAQYVVAAAEMLIDDGRVDDAEKYILSRRDRFEHNPGVLQTLGHIAMMQGDHARALSKFSEARTLAPDDTSIMEDLAQSQVALGRYADAATILSKLLKDEELAARRRDLRLLYGRCLIETQRFVEARDIYLGLTEDDEGAADVDAWIGLGNVAAVLKDPYRLRTAGRRVMNLAPDREEGYLLTAIYHRRRGELADALHSLDLGSTRVADTHEIYTLAGVILTEMGRDEDAKRVLAAALHADPDNTAVAGMLDSMTLSDD